jgi:hypothetical protein
VQGCASGRERSLGSFLEVVSGARFWGWFLGFARIGGVGAGRAHPTLTLSSGRALIAPESSPAANPRNQPQKRAPETFSTTIPHRFTWTATGSHTSGRPDPGCRRRRRQGGRAGFSGGARGRADRAGAGRARSGSCPANRTADTVSNRYARALRWLPDAPLSKSACRRVETLMRTCEPVGGSATGSSNIRRNRRPGDGYLSDRPAFVSPAHPTHRTGE